MPANLFGFIGVIRYMNQSFKPNPKHEVIKFYSVEVEYGEFSNFAPYKIRIGKRTWQTSEHYFQAMKFENWKDQEEVRKAGSPMAAARMGRSRKRKLRRDWDRARIGVMRLAVHAKFTQHPELGALLLFTGDSKIVEHTANDNFWGDGGDGSGANMLGQILMALRSQLSSSDEAKVTW